MYSNKDEQFEFETPFDHYTPFDSGLLNKKIGKKEEMSEREKLVSDYIKKFGNIDQDLTKSQEIDTFSDDTDIMHFKANEKSHQEPKLRGMYPIKDTFNIKSKKIRNKEASFENVIDKMVPNSNRHKKTSSISSFLKNDDQKLLENSSDGSYKEERVDEDYAKLKLPANETEHYTEKEKDQSEEQEENTEGNLKGGVVRYVHRIKHNVQVHQQNKNSENQFLTTNKTHIKLNEVVADTPIMRNEMKQHNYVKYTNYNENEAELSKKMNSDDEKELSTRKYENKDEKWLEEQKEISDTTVGSPDGLNHNHIATALIKMKENNGMNSIEMNDEERLDVDPNMVTSNTVHILMSPGHLSSMKSKTGEKQLFKEKGGDVTLADKNEIKPTDLKVEYAVSVNPEKDVLIHAYASDRHGAKQFSSKVDDQVRSSDETPAYILTRKHTEYIEDTFKNLSKDVNSFEKNGRKKEGGYSATNAGSGEKFHSFSDENRENKNSESALKSNQQSLVGGPGEKLAPQKYADNTGFVTNESHAKNNDHLQHGKKSVAGIALSLEKAESQYHKEPVSNKEYHDGNGNPNSTASLKVIESNEEQSKWVKKIDHQKKNCAYIDLSSNEKDNTENIKEGAKKDQNKNNRDGETKENYAEISKQYINYDKKDDYSTDQDRPSVKSSNFAKAPSHNSNENIYVTHHLLKMAHKANQQNLFDAQDLERNGHESAQNSKFDGILHNNENNDGQTQNTYYTKLNEAKGEENRPYNVAQEESKISSSSEPTINSFANKETEDSYRSSDELEHLSSFGKTVNLKSTSMTDCSHMYNNDEENEKQRNGTQETLKVQTENNETDKKNITDSRYSNDGAGEQNKKGYWNANQDTKLKQNNETIKEQSGQEEIGQRMHHKTEYFTNNQSEDDEQIEMRKNKMKQKVKKQKKNFNSDISSSENSNDGTDNASEKTLDTEYKEYVDFESHEIKPLAKMDLDTKKDISAVNPIISPETEMRSKDSKEVSREENQVFRKADRNNLMLEDTAPFNKGNSDENEEPFSEKLNEEKEEQKNEEKNSDSNKDKEKNKYMVQQVNLRGEKGKDNEPNTVEDEQNYRKQPKEHDYGKYEEATETKTKYNEINEKFDTKSKKKINENNQVTEENNNPSLEKIDSNEKVENDKENENFKSDHGEKKKSDGDDSSLIQVTKENNKIKEGSQKDNSNYLQGNNIDESSKLSNKVDIKGQLNKNKNDFEDKEKENKEKQMDKAKNWRLNKVSGEQEQVENDPTGQPSGGKTNIQILKPIKAYAIGTKEIGHFLNFELSAQDIKGRREWERHGKPVQVVKDEISNDLKEEQQTKSRQLRESKESSQYLKSNKQNDKFEEDKQNEKDMDRKMKLKDLKYTKEIDDGSTQLKQLEEIHNSKKFKENKNTYSSHKDEKGEKKEMRDAFPKKEESEKLKSYNSKDGDKWDSEISERNNLSISDGLTYNLENSNTFENKDIPLELESTLIIPKSSDRYETKEETTGKTESLYQLSRPKDYTIREQKANVTHRIEKLGEYNKIRSPDLFYMRDSVSKYTDRKKKIIRNNIKEEKTKNSIIKKGTSHEELKKDGFMKIYSEFTRDIRSPDDILERVLKFKEIQNNDHASANDPEKENNKLIFDKTLATLIKSSHKSFDLLLQHSDIYPSDGIDANLETNGETQIEGIVFLISG